jgi:hypothetical protein
MPTPIRGKKTHADSVDDDNSSDFGEHGSDSPQVKRRSTLPNAPAGIFP